jgi:hypothetical protein
MPHVYAQTLRHSLDVHQMRQSLSHASGMREHVPENAVAQEAGKAGLRSHAPAAVRPSRTSRAVARALTGSLTATRPPRAALAEGGGGAGGGGPAGGRAKARGAGGGGRSGTAGARAREVMAHYARAFRPCLFVACVYPVAMASRSNVPDESSKRGPGRPRKWTDNAERARAYRQRKAAEHATADELRRERRNLQRRVARLTESLDRSERRRQAVEHRAGRLAETVAHLRADVDALRAALQQRRDHVSITPSPEPTGPAVAAMPVPGNRAARRRAARRRQRPT